MGVGSSSDNKPKSRSAVEKQARQEVKIGWVASRVALVGDKVSDKPGARERTKDRPAFFIHASDLSVEIALHSGLDPAYSAVDRIEAFGSRTEAIERKLLYAVRCDLSDKTFPKLIHVAAMKQVEDGKKMIDYLPQRAYVFIGDGREFFASGAAANSDPKGASEIAFFAKVYPKDFVTFSRKQIGEGKYALELDNDIANLEKYDKMLAASASVTPTESTLKIEERHKPYVPPVTSVPPVPNAAPQRRKPADGRNPYVAPVAPDSES